MKSHSSQSDDISPECGRPQASGHRSCGCSENVPSDISKLTPAYKRALWMVVALNLGYAIVQSIGGWISHSQAVLADSLDFIGDGLITWLGVLALNWSLAWRARSALIQGIFLAVLGAGVLGSTAYRLYVVKEPSPELMGSLGLGGLVVNVLAAAALIPHRKGDANARAVWLFSRNDALANMAVIVAAGLVAWTQTAWPDIVVAIAIASLFLHSAFSIFQDARADLRTSASA